MATKKRKRKPSERGSDGLTDRQRRFVAEYAIDGNATQAAIRAGYSHHRQIGAHLLSNVVVAREIKRRQIAIARKLEVKAEDVVAEYRKVAFSRINNYLSFGADGVRLRDSEQIAADALDAVQEVSERRDKEGGVSGISFKLHSKLGALDALGKHLGLFVERHEHDVGPRLAEVLTRVKERMSPAAQAELVRAVGLVMAEAVASRTAGGSAGSGDVGPDSADDTEAT